MIPQKQVQVYQSDIDPDYDELQDQIRADNEYLEYLKRCSNYDRRIGD